MSGKNLKEMFKFGDWLEQYLNPKITPRDYRELAEKTIKLYNLDYLIDPDDISLKTSEFINNDFDLNLLNKKLLKLTQMLQPPESLIDNIPFPDDDPAGKEKVAKDVRCFWREAVDSAYQAIYKSRAYALHLFKTIPRTNSWESDFYQAHNQGHDTTKQAAVKFLIKAYSGLIENIVLKEHKLEFVRTLNLGTTQTSYTLKPFFPWDVVTSRIFFDFLSHGGQDHYKFCEYCGRFTVIKRRDSKKFCSDICRTASKKK